MDVPMVSVVVPLYNEAKNLEELAERCRASLQREGMAFELIFVNDGSTDESEDVLAGLHGDHACVSVVHLRTRTGKAGALEAGFRLVGGKYVVVIDSDLQHAPEDIPVIIKKLEDGYDVISGKRRDRQDASGKLMSSRLFNGLIRVMTGSRLEDLFSGLKGFRMDVVNGLRLYGDLYRFVPVLAARYGYRVREIPVGHFPRKHGESRYSSGARWRRALGDLAMVMFTVNLNPERLTHLFFFGVLCLVTASALYLAGGSGVSCQGFAGPLAWLGGILVVLRAAGYAFHKVQRKMKAVRSANVRCVLR